MAGYRKAEPLYGAPRGNRVMKSKRVTGPSAHATLRLHVLFERCSHKGCGNPVVLTNPDPLYKRRYCGEHLPSTKVDPPQVLFVESPAAVVRV